MPRQHPEGVGSGQWESEGLRTVPSSSQVGGAGRGTRVWCTAAALQGDGPVETAEERWERTAPVVRFIRAQGVRRGGRSWPGQAWTGAEITQ